MSIRILGDALPGRSVGTRGNVHVGLQKGKELVDLIPADSASAVFELTVQRTDEGDYRGPFVQGKRGDRFIYLVWCDVEHRSGAASMFSRTKLLLATIPANLSNAASLEVRLSLTSEKGAIRTGSVRPADIAWSRGTKGTPTPVSGN